MTGDMKKKNETAAAAESVYERLMGEMKTGEFAALSKLPPETELSKQLQVSRTQLRDALAKLESCGFITRRRSAGTRINRQVLEVRTRMDLELEFLDMVSEAGFEPAIDSVSSETILSDAAMADKLSIPAGFPVLAVTRLILADKKPCIYCVDHIPFNRIKRLDYHEADLSRPIFDFLSTFCHTEIEMDITEVKPLIADAELARVLDVDAGAPILYMDEVGYDYQGNTALWSKEYYADGILRHMVLRKKIQ